MASALFTPGRCVPSAVERVSEGGSEGGDAGRKPGRKRVTWRDADGGSHHEDFDTALLAIAP